MVVELMGDCHAASEPAVCMQLADFAETHALSLLP